MIKISGYLTNHLLIAMPEAKGSVFDKTIIFLCKHDKSGAMGFVVNQTLKNIELSDILDQIEDGPIEFPSDIKDNPPICWGGPSEMNRGFVLHSLDYKKDETLVINDYYAITANLEILKDIFIGKGPKHYLLVLGYAGWDASQLEKELSEHSWIPIPATSDILFDTPHHEKWNAAMTRLGIKKELLLKEAGIA